MTDISSVKAAAPDPKIGKTRPRSDVSFPYYDLNKSIEVARLIHDRAGGGCDRTQLAALLEYSGVKNGGFLSRTSAAKMFGLVEESGEKIVLSNRAKSILSPVRVSDAEQAKVEAFLGVQFYKDFYAEFDGQSLPSEVGLKNLLATKYKIVPKQVDSALRILLDSAESAGLFKVAGNRSKMIKPIISADQNQMPPLDIKQDTPPTTVGDTDQQRKSGNGHGGGSNDGDPPDIHPALLGLLKNLPPVGQTLGPKRRAALIAAFTSTINFVYPEQEDET